MKRSIFLGILMGCSGFLNAAEPLSIADAVQKALQYSPYLQSLQSGEKSAAEKIHEAQAMRAPKVSVGVTESRLNSPMLAFGSRLNQGRIGLADFAPDRLNNPDSINNLQLGAQVAVPLYLGGMDVHAGKAAERGVQAARLDTKKAREDVIFQTIEMYLRVVLARESVEVASKALELSQESVRNAQAAVDAQRAVESDLMQARVLQSENEEGLLRRQNSLQLGRESLATIMGVPSATEYDLTMPFLKQECTSCRENPEALLEKALKQRPDYLKLSEQIGAIGHQEKMARGMVRPRVVLGASVEQNRENLGDSGKNNNMVFGRIDWNVWDGGEARAKSKGAHFQQEQLRKMAEAQRDRIFLEIREAVTTINNALERIRVSEETIAQSRESLRILRDRYTAGLAIMSDLLGAQNSLQAHEMSHIQSLYDYALSKARLKMALGELTPEHCEILQPPAGK